MSKPIDGCSDPCPCAEENKLHLTCGVTLGWFDGGCRGNPGPSAWGFILEYPDQSKFALTGYIGQATNNEAEYAGCIALLEYAGSQGIKNLKVHGDSKLIINQMRGEWNVKSAEMKALWQKAQNVIAEHKMQVEFCWIPREQNEKADLAVNSQLDLAQKKGE